MDGIDATPRVRERLIWGGLGENNLMKQTHVIVVSHIPPKEVQGQGNVNLLFEGRTTRGDGKG